MPTVNSRTLKYITFILQTSSRGYTHARSNWHSDFELKISKVKVTGAETGRAAYRVGHWGRTYLLLSGKKRDNDHIDAQSECRGFSYILHIQV